MHRACISYKNPPLKRRESLRPLSRDHYAGLVQAQRLAALLDAWRAEIAPHFEDEERLLCDLADPESRERLLDEHAVLRRLAEAARARRQRVDPEGAWVRSLGETLRDHIRWEERVMFPCVEQRASTGQLAALAAETGQIEQSRPRGRSRTAG